MLVEHRDQPPMKRGNAARVQRKLLARFVAGPQHDRVAAKVERQREGPAVARRGRQSRQAPRRSAEARRASRGSSTAHGRRGSCRASARQGAGCASVSWSRAGSSSGQSLIARPLAQPFAFCAAVQLRPRHGVRHRPARPNPQRAPTSARSTQLRVAALGKSGEITALLKSLGSMDPDTRAAEAPKIHALREQVTRAIAERKAALEAAELDRKLATETIDLSLPAARTAARHDPPGQPGDGRARRDFRRPRLRRRRRAGDRGPVA